MKQESLPRQTTDYVVGEEVFTGRYYIDGNTKKKIYQKIIEGTSPQQNTNFAFEGYQILQIMGGVMNNSNKDFIPFGYCPDSTNYIIIFCANNNSEINIQNTYYSSRPKYIAIVDYIK